VRAVRDRVAAGRGDLTVLNFANEPIAGTVRSEQLPAGGQVSDVFTGDGFATVDDLHSFTVELDAHQAMSLLVEVPPPDTSRERSS